jgi:hypothetical protein
MTLLTPGVSRRPDTSWSEIWSESQARATIVVATFFVLSALIGDYPARGP